MGATLDPGKEAASGANTGKRTAAPGLACRLPRGPLSSPVKDSSAMAGVQPSTIRPKHERSFF
jgi:hypothetical protein